ncbi:MAG: hypothetical protein QNK23_01805 [Crocinitomicaceae bacterium]|nr:hypothetical protein [Crocinitomicaceae bacterium]
MKLIIKYTFALSLLVLVSSCAKEVVAESSITGVVHAQVRDGFGTVVAEYDIPKEDVYIIFGGVNTFYDDDIETSFDGSFRFDNLELGTYQVFVYEKCLVSEGCADGRRAVITTVEVTENNQVVDLGTINIYK